MSVSEVCREARKYADHYMLTFVTTCSRVRIYRVDRRVVSSLIVRSIIAVGLCVVSRLKVHEKNKASYPIKGVQESVEQISGCNFLGFVDLVIYLVQRHGLRVDQRSTDRSVRMIALIEHVDDTHAMSISISDSPVFKLLLAGTPNSAPLIRAGIG